MIDKNQLLLDLFHAYYDARRNKRNKATSLAFEMNYESKLLILCNELVQRRLLSDVAICSDVLRKPARRKPDRGMLGDPNECESATGLCVPICLSECHLTFRTSPMPRQTVEIY